jgi:excisionase family DNA binding protein
MTAATSTAETSAKLLDVRGVAALLNCSSRHVYRMADEGRMPTPLKLGALVRWRREEIDSWISGGCRPVRTVSGKGKGAWR